MKIIRNESDFCVTDFIINKKYNYNEFSRNDDPSGRTYNVEDHKVPSVTTILSKTQSQEKREALNLWRQRVGYDQAARITNQAAVRGTEMHYILEQYCKGVGYINLSPEGSLPRMMAHKIVDNLDKFSQVYGTEVTLSYENLWAGSSDLIGVYDNLPTIIDFKQSNRPKKDEWIEDYKYQIAAYALAHKKNFGPIKQGLICVCTKDLLFQGFKMTDADIKKYEKKWFKRVELFYKNSKTSSPKV